MTYSKMNIKNFINLIVNFNNVDEIIDTCGTISEKGFIFERLFDIIIKFGFCEIFNNKDFYHFTGNSNNGKLKKLVNLNKYLEENVISSKSSGCSDISLYDKINQEYIFITSKYPKTYEDIKNNKTADYYDIQKIIAMIDHNKHIYTKYKIFLVVRNKKIILDTIFNISSEYITKFIKNDSILDKNDLNKYFINFKSDILKNKDKDLYEIYFNEKEKLNLRFHQELITYKTLKLIKKGNSSFLWGCKCRSGKTYMVGGLIDKFQKIKTKINILIITPAPTETITQFTDDLFNKFKEFKNFGIFNIKNSKMLEKIEFIDNNIIIVSKQLLQKYIHDSIITSIKNLNLDIIVFDENHFTGTTNLSKDILNTYSAKDTIKIYMTATYNKPLKEWNIKKNCMLFWDIEDEIICKSILIDEKNILKLYERHEAKFIDKIINYFIGLKLSINDIFLPYKNMPNLQILTNLFDKERYDKIKNNIIGSSYGFSFDALFSLNDSKKFNYPDEIKTILRYISGSEKELDYKKGDNSIFGRIKKISSRTPFIHIWFLPSDNINLISLNLKELMGENKILCDYNILCINRKNDSLAKDIKDEIIKQETIAKNAGNRGLILLAGNMLNLGITIKNCDVVFLMNNSLSSDKVMQQMYRCMTEAENKTDGFVIDMNIGRVINTCINYNINKPDKTIEEKITYLIENNLINIDSDILYSKKIDSEIIIKKLMDIWKCDPINSFKIILKNLDNEYIIFDNKTQKILNNFFYNSSKEKNIYGSIEFIELDDELQKMPSGRQIYEIKKDEEDIKEQKKEEIKISFTKDILPYIIPLTCILTIKNNNKDFCKMLLYIKDNKELLEIFDEQCLIWWNNKNLIDIIEKIISEYYEKTSNIYNISINFKMSLFSLVDSPKELLELINECLKPKLIEKKLFGEVFTPIIFINNMMLKDIENYYYEKTKTNIWENENIKWYDPAAGMGNYSIAIYYKLMEGLTDKIADFNKRKKHIIENQIYMGELNKKNCFIIKQIFNINNDFNINLYEGDTLNIDLEKVFKIKKFDVIIGNPPYNEEFKESGTSAKPLYNKFIEFYVNKCKILSFIVPSRWFAGGKGLDKFREMMINREDIVYIKHYDDARKIFGTGVNIEGGVNYFLIDNEYKGLCDYNGSKVKFNNLDIILDCKYYGIINKFNDYVKITDLYRSSSHYGITTNSKYLTDDDNLIKCYVSQQKGFIKYIDVKFTKNNINTYKVITARANGKNGCFGNMFIGYPNEVCTQSYILFEVLDEIEAKSLLSFMKCKLPNFMLSLRKISQDISSNTCKWIPLVPLNREWTDRDIYEYFNLSDDEIKLITETKIIGYTDFQDKHIIIKDGRKQYYLIEEQLFKVKKDKSIGELAGYYIDNKIITK